MKIKSRKIVLILYFILIIFIKGESLSSISGISELKNFEKLKKIESEKILDYDSEIIFNGLAYIKNSGDIFTGIAVQKIKNRIKSINFYENGELTTYYKYFPNGKIDELKETNKEKKQSIYETYNENGKIISRVIYENGLLKSENQYRNGKLAIEYTFGNNGDKKILSEMEELKNNKNNEKQQIPEIIKTFGKNGNLEREYTFKNKTLEGQLQKIYYPNGNLKYVAIAKNNDMTAMEIKELYEEYNSDGTKKMSCKEIEEEKWNCEYYKKNGEIKTRKHTKKDFSKNMAVSYKENSGVEFLKGIGKGIFMILEELLRSALH